MPFLRDIGVAFFVGISFISAFVFLAVGIFKAVVPVLSVIMGVRKLQDANK